MAEVEYQNAKYEIANASEAWFTIGGQYAWGQLWAFTFGAYGDLHVLVWQQDVEAALEDAAEYLEYMKYWGHLMAHDSDELQELYREAADELFGEDHGDLDSDQQEEAWEAATADLTYTEAGYLTSYEWGVVEVTEETLIRRALEASVIEDPDQLDDDDDGPLDDKLRELGATEREALGVVTRIWKD